MPRGRRSKEILSRSITQTAHTKHQRMKEGEGRAILRIMNEAQAHILLRMLFTISWKHFGNYSSVCIILRDLIKYVKYEKINWSLIYFQGSLSLHFTSFSFYFAMPKSNWQDNNKIIGEKKEWKFLIIFENKNDLVFHFSMCSTKKFLTT